MSILVNDETRVVVQGISGREGSFHTKQMLAYGTKVVAGVTPGRGGEEVLGVPVFDTVRQAVEAASPNVSIIFVPPVAAGDAALEAIEAGVPLRETTATAPGRWMWPGMIPILAAPGVMMPGQFGPMMRVPRCSA